MTWCARDLFKLPHLGLSTTEKDFHRKLKHLRVPARQWPDFLGSDMADATTHFFANDRNLCAVVCLRPGKSRTAAEVASLVTHEAVHVWRWAMRNINEKNPSEEFMAYGIQSITQSLLTALWRGKK